MTNASIRLRAFCSTLLILSLWIASELPFTLSRDVERGSDTTSTTAPREMTSPTIQR